MTEPRSSGDHAHSSQVDEAFEHIPPPHTAPNSLSQAVYQRRSEYTRPRSVKIKIGSWNVAACPDVEKDVGSWFVEGKGIDKKLAGLEISNGITEDRSQDQIESVTAQEQRRSPKQPTIPLGDKGTVVGGDDVGLYVLGLQEMVELSSAKEYIGRVYVDPAPAMKWKKAVSSALPEGYELVTEQQLSGLLMLIYASPEVAPTINSVSSVSVGTGFMGYLGNKGAVTTRIVLGETTRLVFVNCHLASGTDSGHLDRRCWDVSQILTRTQFDPITRAGVVSDAQESIGDEDFAFWFGDLNFRLERLPGEDIRRLLMLHSKGEYGRPSKSKSKIDSELSENDEPIVIHHIDSDDDSTEASTPKTGSTNTTATTLPDPDDFVQDPHSDPLSLQATIDSLLPHDQLRHVQKARKAFHDGWREGPIHFLPTYKYDVGSVGLFDSSEKRRSPSWCDRILFRTRRDKLEYDEKHLQEEEAKRRDAEMKARGIDHAADDDEVLFDYDPEADGEADEGPEDAARDYDEYDDTHEEHNEVIIREGFVDKLDLDVYTSHQRVISSDHKPLDAVFTLLYDAVVPELKSQVQAEVARELDRAENEGRPGVTVVVDHSQEVDDMPSEAEVTPTPNRKTSTDATGGVDFGEVRYLGRKSRALTIANTGAVSATFAFVSRPAEPGEPDQIAPEWLSVRFASSDDDEKKKNNTEITLEPGNAINAVLEVYVQKIEHVRALNEGNIRLEDVLVLRVTEGRDHFIPLRGTWMQSCFGRSIDELIRVPEGGVRALLPPRKGAQGGHVNRGEPVCWSAPRELFKLTEACQVLTERTVADRDMIEGMKLPSSGGWPFDSDSWSTDVKFRETRISYVLEALDNDRALLSAFPPEVPAAEKLEIVGDVLVKFLGGLSDGIITETLWNKMQDDMKARKQAITPEEERAWVLDVLSSAPNHNICLVFLTSTLSKMASDLAPMSPASLASAKSTLSKRSIDVRRSLSFKGRLSTGASPDAAITRRQEVEARWAETMALVVFRGAPWREKERRWTEERRKEIFELFLRGDRD